VVAGSVIISAFVSLTLTPMLSSKLLKTRKRQPWLYRTTEPFFEWMISGYERSLTGFLRVRWMAWVIMVGMVGIVYALFKTNAIPSELAPLEDRGGFRISATAPEGATFEYMLNFTDRVGQAIRAKFDTATVPGVITITSPSFGSGATNTATIRMYLGDRPPRTMTQQQVVDEVNPILKKFPGARTFASQEQTIQTGQRGGGGGGLPVQFVIQANSFDKLRAKVPEFMKAVQASEKFAASDINLKFTKPEIRLDIDRDKALNLGVSVQDVAQTLQLGLSGRRFGYFIMDGKQYQVIGQIERQDRNDITDLKSLFVKNNRGELIQLDNLVRVSEQSTPPTLYRFNRYSSATVSAGLAKGVSLGDGIAEMERIAKETLDPTFNTALDGTSKEFRESSSSLYFAFALALLLIYLILAAQFESFVDPIIILLTVPLAVCGALLSLWDFSQTLNVFSQIGIITLVGLVTKNGILIVEFANQRKEHGANKRQAVLEGAVARFRPILMTSLCAALGLLPVALALGAGSESRVSMGIVVVGGLIFSTALTLYVIPAVYTYLSRPVVKREEEEEAGKLVTAAY
jgi:multidrug efflux pump subunit AcrB